MDWSGIEPEPPRRQVGDKRTNKKSTVLLRPLLHWELTKLKLTEDSSFLNFKGIHCFQRPLSQQHFQNCLPSH